METSQMIAFLGLAGGIVGIYVRVMMAITAQQTEICSMKKNFDDHKNENSYTFNEMAKVLKEVSAIHLDVSLNSERIISITQQFDIHKEQNDKSFTAIAEMVKQNRLDNKDEHTELKQLIRELKA
jgi:uncharacterized membrane-anchored protein YhcB (DUF1043 family)